MQVDLNNLRALSHQRPLAALGSEILSWSDLTAVCQPGFQRERSLFVPFLLGTVPRRLCRDGPARLWLVHQTRKLPAGSKDPFLLLVGQIWMNVMEGYRANFV